MVRKGSPVRVRHWAPEHRVLRHLAPRARPGPAPRPGASRAARRRGLRRHDQRRTGPPARARGRGRRPRDRGRDRRRVGRLVLPAGAASRAASAIAREADPDWVLVLSGQDYPLVHHAELKAFLEGSGHDAHLTHLWPLGPLTLSGEARDEFVLRYGYRHFARAAVALAPAAADRLRPPHARRQAPARRARSPRLGPAAVVSGDWPTLNRQALRAVLAFPGAPPGPDAPLPPQRRGFGVAVSPPR